MQHASNSILWLKGAGISLLTLAFLGTGSAAFSSVVFDASEVPRDRLAELEEEDAEDTSSEEESETPTDSEEETSTPTANTPRFTCEYHQNAHTVMYSPEEAEQAYPWAIPQALGGGWTPQKRCEVIAQRLEQYRPDGLLELRNAMENNYDTVCVTTERDPACRIVLTVPPGQNPEIVRDRVFENLTLADGGQSTQGVTTLVEGSEGRELLNELGNIFGIEGVSGSGNVRLGSPGAINLKPFLAPSDGGTGEGLSNLRSRPGRQLNPDRFR